MSMKGDNPCQLLPTVLNKQETTHRWQHIINTQASTFFFFFFFFKLEEIILQKVVI